MRRAKDDTTSRPPTATGASSRPPEVRRPTFSGMPAPANGAALAELPPSDAGPRAVAPTPTAPVPLPPPWAKARPASGTRPRALSLPYVGFVDGDAEDEADALFDTFVGMPSALPATPRSASSFGDVLDLALSLDLPKK